MTDATGSRAAKCVGWGVDGHVCAECDPEMFKDDRILPPGKVGPASNQAEWRSAGSEPPPPRSAQPDSFPGCPGWVTVYAGSGIHFVPVYARSPEHRATAIRFDSVAAAVTLRDTLTRWIEANDV